MAEPHSTTSDLLSDVERGDDGAVRAKVSGEITLHNSPALRNDLLTIAKRETPDRVELDLAEVPYMDSSAIAVLVELLKQVRAGGGVVRLTNLQPRVKGLLQIARLDSIFEMSEQDE